MTAAIWFSIVLILTVVLLIPIPTKAYVYFDLQSKKFVYSVMILYKIKVLGGFITFSSEGITIEHKKDKKILLYKDLIGSHRKKVKLPFKFRKIDGITEIGKDEELSTYFVCIYRVIYPALHSFLKHTSSTLPIINNRLILREGLTVRIQGKSELHSSVFKVLKFLINKKRENNNGRKKIVN